MTEQRPGGHLRHGGSVELMATPIPSNRVIFQPEELARAAQGRWLSPMRGPACGVTTDSRKDVRDHVFVALRGERFDGHLFASDVARRGAAALIVEDVLDLPAGVGVLQVSSSLEALGRLGEFHRQRWGGRLVTIAGSAGKTTTRVATEALARALAPGRIHATPGNLNNLIGVPMTLLGLLPEHELAVIEIGTNAPGEIARLTQMCAPDYTIMTCLGLEHSLLLGDIDGVVAEESQAFAGMGEKGVAIGHADDPRIARLLSTVTPRATRSYGTSLEHDYCLVERRMVGEGVMLLRLVRHERMGGGSLSIETRLVGQPGALAALAGLALVETWQGRHLEQGELEGALSARELGEAGRLVLHRGVHGGVVIDDCYNANPASMVSSINYAHEVASRDEVPLVLVLGDMLELGEPSTVEHTRLAEKLGKVATVVTVGVEMRNLELRARELGYTVLGFEEASAAARAVEALVPKRAVVLVKGSRGMRMEGIVTQLTEQKEVAG